MNIRCVHEHNGNDTILYAIDFLGAFTRGKSKEIAISKMKKEVLSYALWCGASLPEIQDIIIVQDAECSLSVSDADSDVLFEEEMHPLTLTEYNSLKALTLKSASDFLTLYGSIKDKTRELKKPRSTFYGKIPSTAEEMYIHTKNVNEYYFGEIGVKADNSGDILSCRIRGFENLEKQKDFLSSKVCDGSYGERWTLRKLLRRFIWHDRIHARAMYRAASAIWGVGSISNIFKF